MTTVTFANGTVHENHIGEKKKIVTVFVDGSYEDTMIMDVTATDGDAMRLYEQRMIEAEETKLARRW